MLLASPHLINLLNMILHRLLYFSGQKSYRKNINKHNNNITILMSLQSATQSVVVLKAKKPTTINVNVMHSANQKPVFLALNQKMPSNLQPISIAIIMLIM